MCSPLKSFLSSFVRFLGLAWPGAAAGLAIAAILFGAYGGLFVSSGLGTAIEVACGLLFGAVVLILIVPVIMLGSLVVRRVPLRFTALIVAVLICLVATGRVLDLSPALSIRLGALPILLFAAAGAGISILRRRGPGRAGVVHIVVACLLLLATTVSGGAVLYWLAAPGDDPFFGNVGPAAPRSVAPLEAPDPSEIGPHEVTTLCYGSGTDRHRPEYGQNVDLKADSVDASALLPSPKGFNAWNCDRYWGFEPNSLPRNARVWFPTDDGVFPLVLIVHGNRRMTDFSDPGYAYLGELLASRGFIVASVDESFLNDGWFGDDHGVRGWLLLKHLELWRSWNERQGNPFYQKVDMMNIALIGHSRGGEAITHAATFNGLSHHPDFMDVAFDFGFDIRTLIAIAPTEGQYYPRGQPVPIGNVNYLVLQGSHDSDLGSFPGMGAYRRVLLGKDDYRMKAALYIHRANHSQFNTAWGRSDLHPPLAYLLNRRSLLNGDDQRAIAKIYVSAFLEATLYGKYEYIPMFRDHRYAAHWLPQTLYVSRFQDGDFFTITDFDRHIDGTKTAIPGGSQEGHCLDFWQVREIKGRRGRPSGDYACVLGWDTAGTTAETASYTISLPEALPLGWWLDVRTILTFCLADAGERSEPRLAGGSGPEGDNGSGQAHAADPNENRASIDLTLELVASDGTAATLPLSHVYPLPPAIRVTLTKWPRWERAEYKSPVEPMLQTLEVPLGAFVKVNPDFDPGQLRQIRFRFDRTKSGVLLLDQVGLTRNRYAPVAF